MPGNIEATASGPSDLLLSATLLNVAQPESLAASGIGRSWHQQISWQGRGGGGCGDQKWEEVVRGVKTGKVEGVP